MLCCGASVLCASCGLMMFDSVCPTGRRDVPPAADVPIMLRGQGAAETQLRSNWTCWVLLALLCDCFYNPFAANHLSLSPKPTGLFN